MTGFIRHPPRQPRKSIDGVKISKTDAEGISTVTERATGALVGYISGHHDDWNGFDADKNVIVRNRAGHRTMVAETLYRLFLEGVNKDPHPSDVRDKLTRWEYKALAEHIRQEARRETLIETVHVLEDLIAVAKREMPTNRLSTRDVERSLDSVRAELEKVGQQLATTEAKH